MNLLMDALPSHVEWEGQAYEINSDFRVWIQFELLTTGGDFSPQRLVTFLKACYFVLPPTIELAMRLAAEFYAAHRHNSVSAKTKESDSDEEPTPQRIYDYEYDADHIYSAFYAQYNIDLQTARLHWYQFRALFASLEDEHQIVKIMQYRSMNINSIKDKEQKKYYRSMKQLYRLPDMRSEEEKEKHMLGALEQLF